MNWIILVNMLCLCIDLNQFGTIGHLTTEIWVILEVHPLDFCRNFSFISSVYIKNHEIFMINIFHIIPHGKSTMSKH